MKFSSTLASTLLLASSALAAPAPSKTGRHLAKLDKERAAARIRAFTEGRRASKPNSTVPDASTDTSNWGGAQQTNTAVTGITGSLTVPTVSFPSNAGTPDPSEEYYGCAWVGIDGWNSCQGLQQAGAYWEAQGGGDFSYYAFYEWYPAGVNFFSMDVSPGDELSVNLVATSTTSGTFSVSDTTTGQTATTSLAGQATLCQQTAEWIVEDNLPSELPYADFGSVTFTDAAYTANGQTLGVSGATILALNNNGITWTNCGTSGDSTVTCSYMS